MLLSGPREDTNSFSGNFFAKNISLLYFFRTECAAARVASATRQTLRSGAFASSESTDAVELDRTDMVTAPFSFERPFFGLLSLNWKGKTVGVVTTAPLRSAVRRSPLRLNATRRAGTRADEYVGCFFCKRIRFDLRTSEYLLQNEYHENIIKNYTKK